MHSIVGMVLIFLVSGVFCSLISLAMNALVRNHVIGGFVIACLNLNLEVVRVGVVGRYSVVLVYAIQLLGVR